VHILFLENAEVVPGLVKRALVARLVAEDEGERGAFGSEVAEGDGEAHGGWERGILEGHFAGEFGRLDCPGAALEPEGCGHGFDEELLGERGGLVFF